MGPRGWCLAAYGLAIAACASAGPANTPGDGPGGGDAGGDGPMRRLDGSGSNGLDAALDGPAAPAATLLLSEVMLGPSGGEFIEICNPTAATVDLSNYYVSDAGDYWKVPTGISYKTASSDFVGHFKAGSTLASGGVATIAIGTAAAFSNLTGTAPTYSLADGTITSLYSSSTQAGLTDAGEVVVLFTWDGTSALVEDVDMLEAGVPATGNQLVTKSGVAQGGSTYKTDANTLPLQASAPPSGMSTKRIAREAGHETQNGTGNGITGDDETSEDTSVTWDSAFSPPTPGTVPAVLMP